MKNKLLKFILALFVTVILLIGGLMILFVNFIPQEKVKTKIVELVNDKTGRELAIEGAVQWTFFPWLGIKMQDVALSNPPNFENSDFVRVGEINVNVKLLPLFWGRIEAGHLAFKNFSLWLIKNRSATNNWQYLLEPTVTKNKVNKVQAGAPSTGNNDSKLMDMTISSISIDNGQVFWQDQRDQNSFAISNLQLFCKNIDLRQPFEIKTSFYWQNDTSAINCGAKVSAQIEVDIANKKGLLRDLQITGKLKNKNSEQQVDFGGNTSIEIDLQKQTFTSNNFKLYFADLAATGSAYGTNILALPNVASSMTLNQFDLDALMAITSVASKGSTSVKTLVQAPSKQVEGSKSPFSFLRSLKLSSDLKIGLVKVKNLNFTNFSTKIIGDKGLIQCSKINFDFYRGGANGNATIDMRGAIPQVNLQLALRNVAMQPLLTDIAKYRDFSGILTLDTNISIHGVTGEAMLNSLNGTGNMLIIGGSYRGVDIPYEVRRAHAVLNHKPMSSAEKSPHTNFDRLTMTFKINNALFDTNDFLIQAPDYKVTGQGGANLASQHLDLRLSAYSTHDESFWVPIKITGSFSNPSIKPDVAVLVKQMVKEEIKKQIEKPLQMLNVPKEIIKVLPLDRLLQ